MPQAPRSGIVLLAPVLVPHQILDQPGPMSFYPADGGINCLLAAISLAQYFERGQRHQIELRPGAPSCYLFNRLP